MSADVFVFVAQHRAPREADLLSTVSAKDGIYVAVNVPPADLTTHETTFAYVAWTIGAFRVDTITYRGGDDGQRQAADVLERWYTDVPALADPDTDGIFTHPGAGHAAADDALREVRALRRPEQTTPMRSH